MKTFYLKHFYKTTLIVLTLLLGMSGWGQTETIFSENMGIWGLELMEQLQLL